MAKVLVLYYSPYGHTETMAGAVAEGARAAGGAVEIVGGGEGERQPSTIDLKGDRHQGSLIAEIATPAARSSQRPAAIPAALKAFTLALALTSTVSAAQDTLPHERLTPSDIEARTHSGPGTGSSGVAGIQTVVLKGDPTRPGMYTILLKVPAHATIQAHHHPDERVATVTSGTWYFGYGSRFDEQSLKALPPGSFYTEPSNEPHFARTGDAPVSVQITGFGPSGTHYEDQSDDPTQKH